MTKPVTVDADSSASVQTRQYPHARDDCAECHGHDADLIATWSDHEVRWCHRCTGVALSLVTNLGFAVTVRAVDRVIA